MASDRKWSSGHVTSNNAWRPTDSGRPRVKVRVRQWSSGHDTSNNAWRPTDSGRPAMSQVIMHGIRQTVSSGGDLSAAS